MPTLEVFLKRYALPIRSDLFNSGNKAHTVTKQVHKHRDKEYIQYKQNPTKPNKTHVHTFKASLPKT